MERARDAPTRTVARQRLKSHHLSLVSFCIYFMLRPRAVFRVCTLDAWLQATSDEQDSLTQTVSRLEVGTLAGQPSG